MNFEKKILLKNQQKYYCFSQIFIQKIYRITQKYANISHNFRFIQSFSVKYLELVYSFLL